MFTLNDILQGNPGQVQCNREAEIDGEHLFPTAQHDSRKVGIGDLFVAIKGTTVDGHRFIADALLAGASGYSAQPLQNIYPKRSFRYSCLIS